MVQKLAKRESGELLSERTTQIIKAKSSNQSQRWEEYESRDQANEQTKKIIKAKSSYLSKQS